MLKKVLDWVKPVVGAVIIIALLRVTGLMANVSDLAQTAVLKTGVRNASTKPIKNPDDFNYGFTIKDIKGEKFDFNAYKGKVVFLNVWATWCGPCRAEMPTIQSLYEKMDTTAVEFVILSVDRDADVGKIQKYISKYNYTFPVFQPSGYLTSQLNVPNIPTTLIINKEGKVISKEIGATNFDTAKFRKFLQSLVDA